jgi:hypothetical protein
LFSKSVYTTIDVPDSNATVVDSINAQGEIVGSFDDTRAVSR